MADLTLLTYDLTSPAGAPAKYRIVHDADVLVIRAYFGPATSDPYLSVAEFRVKDNDDTRVQLYGECVLWNPIIRSEGPLTLTNENGNEDIVSFRKADAPSGAPGLEVLHVASDGSLVVQIYPAYASLHATDFFRNVLGTVNTYSGLNSGTSCQTAYLTTTATDDVEECLAVFPSRIPQGATITAVGLTYRLKSGVSPATNSVKLHLFRTSIATGTGEDLHQTSSDIADGTIRWVSSGLDTPEVVDYESYCYGVWVELRNDDAGESRFHGALILYTHTLVGG